MINKPNLSIFAKKLPFSPCKRLWFQKLDALFACLVLNNASPYSFCNEKEVKTMQKTKLFTITILAALLVCSALSLAAAQEDTPTTAPNVSSTTAPSPDQSGPPVEGEGTDPSVGGAREPVTGDNLNGIDGDIINPGVVDENATLYAAYGQEAQDKTATQQDNTTLYITVGGAVAAIAVGGAVGFVYYRKTKN